MKQRKRKPLIPDESPLEFFQRIQVPEVFKKDKFQYSPNNESWSYGYWYWINRDIKVRIVFITPSHRGGILEMRMRFAPPKISSICSNMQSHELNEFIKNYIINV